MLIYFSATYLDGYPVCNRVAYNVFNSSSFGDIKSDIENDVKDMVVNQFNNLKREDIDESQLKITIELQ